MEEPHVLIRCPGCGDLIPDTGSTGEADQHECHGEGFETNERGRHPDDVVEEKDPKEH